MFSEGALIVGFSDLNTAEGTINPAKKAGLRLGDRVVRMDGVLTETNERCTMHWKPQQAPRCG